MLVTPTAHRWSLIATSREICVRTLYTSWRTKSLCVPRKKLSLLRAIHISGHLNVGADILSRQGLRPGEWMLLPEVSYGMDNIWAGSSGPLCDSGDIIMSSLVFSNSSSSPGTLHFMVRIPPARPSQLPDWYSSGVLAGPFLCRVNHSTIKVYVAAIVAYHAPLGGQSVGRYPTKDQLLVCYGPPERGLPAVEQTLSW